MRRPLPSQLSVVVFLVLVSAVNAAGAGRIEGRLTLPDGHGISGVTVTATPASVSTITGADGQFVLDGIPDGEQTVVFTLADFAETVTVVVAGAPVRVDRTVDWVLRYTDTVTVTGALRRRQRLVEAPASANVVPAEIIARDGGHGQLAQAARGRAGRRGRSERRVRLRPEHARIQSRAQPSCSGPDRRTRSRRCAARRAGVGRVRGAARRRGAG